jgi:hypothetical protein
VDRDACNGSLRPGYVVQIILDFVPRAGLFGAVVYFGVFAAGAILAL